MTTKLKGFEYKGITVMVGSYGREKMALFTKNGQYLIRDTKEEMIKAIDLSLAARAEQAAWKEAALVAHDAFVKANDDPTPENIAAAESTRKIANEMSAQLKVKP